MTRPVEGGAVELHEGRRDRRADVERIRQVLDGLSFPAARWEVLAQADHYGADSVSRAQLSMLPVGTYRGLAEVLAALGLVVPNRRFRTVRPPAAVSRQLR
jgi:hypothetical protein